MEKQSTENTKSPSQLIDERIEELGDWRGQMLSKLRSLIRQVDPEVVEEWKWRGTPRIFSTQAWMGTPGGPSTSTRETRWTRRHLRN
jgi:hypothetical protein